MQSKYGVVGLILALILSVLYVVDKLDNSGSQKFGVVQMDELVYEYQGMTDATKEYTNKMDEWSAQSDSIKSLLQNMLMEIKMDSITNDQTKLLVDQQRFMLMQQQYYQFQQNIQQKSTEEDQQMTIGVVNQLKEHIKLYAEENGYDLIIANTQLQNVGYVNDVTDLTQQVLDYANSKYEGE